MRKLRIAMSLSRILSKKWDSQLRSSLKRTKRYHNQN